MKRLVVYEIEVPEEEPLGHTARWAERTGMQASPARKLEFKGFLYEGACDTYIMERASEGEVR